MFKVFYLIFVVSIIFGGSIYFGPATMRQYMSVVMGLYIIKNFGILRRFFNSYIYLFLLFTLIYGLSSLYEGEFSTYLRLLISAYFVAIVAYLATCLFIVRFREYQSIIITFLLCGLINGFITLLQFLNNPIALSIGALFVDANNDQKMAELSHIMAGESGVAQMGLLGDAVLNGFLMVLMPLFVMGFIYKVEKVSMSKHILYAVLYSFFIICLFAIQERFAFLLAVALTILTVYYFSPKTKKVLVMLVMLSVAMMIPVIMSQEWFVESRFSEDAGEDSRISIYSYYVAYIFEHPLLGGINTARRAFSHAPHNFIINAYCYAGFLGGTVILLVILRQLKTAFVLLKNKFMVGIALAYVGYTFNGLTHNSSIVTGDVILWILWGIMFVTAKYNYKIKV